MRLKFTFLLLLTAALSIAQQKGIQSFNQIQESPAGSRIIWFLQKVIDGAEVTDEEISTHFATKLIDAMGKDRLTGMITQLNEDEQELHLYQANRKGKLEYKLKVKGLASDAWFDMVFYFEDQDPYKIIGIQIDDTDKKPMEDKPMFPTK